MYTLFGLPVVETPAEPDNQPGEIVFGTWKQYWEKKAMESLDREVWEALGFGDKWFPPDVPTCGPGWTVEIKSITDPANPGWHLFGSFPPVSRDWNLAMWAAEKAGIWKGTSFVLGQSGVHWEIGEVNFKEGFVEGLVSVQSGPTAVCRVILSHLKNAESE